MSLFQDRNFFKINLFSFETFCRTFVSKLLNTLFLFGACSLVWIALKFGFLASFSALSSALVSLGFTWYIRWAKSFLSEFALNLIWWLQRHLPILTKVIYWNIVLKAEKIWEGLNNITLSFCQYQNSASLVNIGFVCPSQIFWATQFVFTKSS